MDRRRLRHDGGPCVGEEHRPVLRRTAASQQPAVPVCHHQIRARPCGHHAHRFPCPAAPRRASALPPPVPRLVQHVHNTVPSAHPIQIPATRSLSAPCCVSARAARNRTAITDQHVCSRSTRTPTGARQPDVERRGALLPHEGEPPPTDPAPDPAGHNGVRAEVATAAQHDA